MTQNSALTTLKDLAEKEVDDAALRLGEMRRGCQQAEEQLKMLMDYQHEYRNNLNNDMSRASGPALAKLSAVYSNAGEGHRAASTTTDAVE